MVETCDPFGDAQSQSHSSGLSGSGFIHTVESFENILLLFLRNANSRIRHFDQNLTFILFQIDPNRPLFRCKFDGIINQVCKKLLKANFIPFYRYLFDVAQRDVYFFLLGKDSKKIV